MKAVRDAANEPRNFRPLNCDTAMPQIASALGSAGSPNDSSISKPKSRAMQKTSLLGDHRHQTLNGHSVTIVMRDDRYMARGRLYGRQWGLTLGASEQEAAPRLSRLLTELSDGLFEPRSTAHRSVLQRGPVPKLSLRELCDLFLRDIANTRGPQLMLSYLSRLAHCLEFAEQSRISRRWKLASQIDHEFIVELRTVLMQSDVRPNGKAGATPRKMSVKMVRLCLEALRAVLNWAKRPQVRKLPADYYHPITEEILGPISPKNPLRPSPLSLAKRIEIVQKMDTWQLNNIAILLVIPTRFEDVSGALISDFDEDKLTWTIGTRFGGADFTKGKTSVVMPLPPVIGRLLTFNVQQRKDGPMFRRRKALSANAKTHQDDLTRDGIEGQLNLRLARSRDGSNATAQGRKMICRKLLRHNFGGYILVRQLQSLHHIEPFN